MGIVTDINSNPSQKFFDRMNTAFCAIWILFPLTVAVLLYYIANPQTMLEGLTPDQIKCLGEKLSFGQGSTANTIASSILILYEVGFYILMFALLHRMIRSFKSGSIFVGKTLASVQMLGWILVFYPLVAKILNIAANAVLRNIGEPVVSGADYYIDLGPIAVGLFLVALKHVLHHAMRMKFENDLTI
jgi:Protein of unknown function (DUF2975)